VILCGTNGTHPVSVAGAWCIVVSLYEERHQVHFLTNFRNLSWEKTGIGFFLLSTGNFSAQLKGNEHQLMPFPDSFSHPGDFQSIQRGTAACTFSSPHANGSRTPCGNQRTYPDSSRLYEKTLLVYRCLYWTFKAEGKYRNLQLVTEGQALRCITIQVPTSFAT
jgi:hypothetical protein